MFVHISFVTLYAICIYLYISASKKTTFSTQNKLLYIKLFFMKKQFYFSSEYVAPELEVISAVVEHGFSVSWGEEGYAGQDGYVNDYDGGEL